MQAVLSECKKSINEAGVWSSEEISAIWDFYVTKSVAASASQKRAASDYGLRRMPYDTLLDFAKISGDRRELLMADRIDGVLKEYGFLSKEKDEDGKEKEAPIEVDVPCFVAIRPYSITDRNKPVAREEGKGTTLLTHVRNSLAHGCTYFFDNGKMLLEDKINGSKGKTTAMLLMPQSALLDWIKIIDINAKYYFKDVDRAKYYPLVTRLDTDSESGRNPTEPSLNSEHRSFA